MTNRKFAETDWVTQCTLPAPLDVGQPPKAETKISVFEAQFQFETGCEATELNNSDSEFARLFK